MEGSQESLRKVPQIASPALEQRLVRHSRSYRCRCGNRIFFRNTLCLACRSQLGYLPETGRLAALDPGPVAGIWHAEGHAGDRRLCANREAPAWCNWTLAADDAGRYCVACRLNRTIPRLADPENALYWSKLEIAKRRLVSELIGFGRRCCRRSTRTRSAA